MPSPLVECVPNFSEARRPEIIKQIQNEIQSVQGVRILDCHSDLDHNRTVITYVGSPSAVEEAAFRAIALAAQLIDLNQHNGEHPRIGATDVVPFIPIAEFTMQECVEMARRLAKRVAQECAIPVYLYEEAATRPDRQNLENIRRGQFEGLKEEITSNPDRAPDFGPCQLGPAGATVIGARQPLIAFNIYLTTDDVTIAQKIAKAVRHSSGGLRFVKAMGVLVDGRAQVSMNLTNFHQSPVARVVELVRREAERYGVAVHHSELVGLIPQQALIDASTWYLQLDQFEPNQILESRLFEAMPSSQPSTASVEPTFLDCLASGTPTPGGGSAAAFSGAQAAALVAMVARLTVGKKKYASVEPQMWIIIEQAEQLRSALTLSVEADAAAFDAILTAVRLPKNTPEEQTIRAQQLELATLAAARVPFTVCHLALQVMELSVQVAGLGNLNAISDAASAFALGKAAFTGASLNVRINLLNMTDKSHSEEMLPELQKLEASIIDFELSIRTALTERMNLTF